MDRSAVTIEAISSNCSASVIDHGILRGTGRWLAGMTRSSLEAPGLVWSQGVAGETVQEPSAEKNSEEAGWLAGGDQASSGYESGREVGSQLQRHSSSSSLVALSPHSLHFSLPTIPRVALLPGNIQLFHSVCLTSALLLLSFQNIPTSLRDLSLFCQPRHSVSAYVRLLTPSHCHTSYCFFCPNNFLQGFLFSCSPSIR
ncbi:hypothetical protein BDW71DRAFT_83000 [Aspergillus fruticulosus]